MRRPYRGALLLLLAFLAACGSPGTPRPPGPGTGTINFDAADRTPESCGAGAGLGALGVGDWSASMPARPEDAVVILDPGHGGLDGGACIASAPGNGGCNNVACASELNAAGLGSLTEAQLTLATALRLKAILERMGFKVGLTRTGTYGGRGLSVSAAMSGDARLYEGSANELALRGWQCERALAAEGGCPWLTLRGKSRVHQILDSFGFSLGDSGVADARVAYISIHYDSASVSNTIGPLIFASKVRDPGNRLSANPALGGAGPVDFRGNYVRHLFDYLIASVRQSQRLEQYKRADLVVYEDGFYPSEADFTYKDGPLQGSGLRAKVKRRAGNFGTVSVASGFEGVTKRPRPHIVSIPQNLTFEVANIRDCANVPTLARSIKRGQDDAFDADSVLPDPTDPLDVAAEDIAHGLVEYYESYVPGFKQKACDNLKNSDWKDHMPDWCTSGGGGGGADVPDIDDVRPASIDVDVWMTDGAANPPVEVSFGNVGTADLLATISTDSPIANIGPPDVYPAGTAVPLDGSQSVRVPPGERARVEVGFQCTEVGEYTGSIAIRSNDPDEREVTIPMLVNCIAPKISVPVLPVPYITAINYIGLPNRDSWVLPDTFDFSEVGGVAPLDFQLETPSWLELKPEQGRLEPGESYSSYAARYTSKVYCGEAGEQEGEVVIRSNDPVNPVVQVPVRLLCPELEVTFSPETYDGWECPPLSGSIEVQNTPHLIELYTDVTSDAEGSILDVQYREPLFIYYPQNTPKYRLKRWPILHGDQGEDSEWSWSQYPHLPFTSWMNSCGYAALGNPEHVVEEFYLLHPRRNDSNHQRLLPFVAGLKSPSVFYTPVPFPGKIINTTSYTAVGTFSIGNHPTQSYSLPPTGSIWARFSFGMHGEKIKYYDDKGREVASFYTPGTRQILSWADLWGCRFHPDVSDDKELYWHHEIPTGGGPFHIVRRSCYPSLMLTDYSYYEPPWYRGETPVEKEPVDWTY